jgi:hypothetical protein
MPHARADPAWPRRAGLAESLRADGSYLAGCFSNKGRDDTTGVPCQRIHRIRVYPAGTWGSFRSTTEYLDLWCAAHKTAMTPSAARLSW